MCHCSPEKYEIGRTPPSTVDIFLKTMVVERKLSFDHLTIGIPAHKNKEENRHPEPTISSMSIWVSVPGISFIDFSLTLVLIR